MRVLSAALALLASVITGPAYASWKIGKTTDRMNDRNITYATLDAREESSGVTGSLHLSCVQNIGVVAVNLMLSQRMTQGRISITFRVDDRLAETHGSAVGSTSQDVPIRGFNAEFLRGAKRFRLQLQPFGGRELFYEFDVVGIETALKAINCKRPA